MLSSVDCRVCVCIEKTGLPRPALRAAGPVPPVLLLGFVPPTPSCGPGAWWAASA